MKSASTPTIPQYYARSGGPRSDIDEQTAEGAADLVDPAGVLPTVWFQKVPEVKTSKNRVHLDIRVREQEREPLVEALLALDGTVVATYPRFTTLADPEGNELCVTTQ